MQEKNLGPTYLKVAINLLEAWMAECPGDDRNDFIADSIDLLRFQLKDDEKHDAQTQMEMETSTIQK